MVITSQELLARAVQNQQSRNNISNAIKTMHSQQNLRTQSNQSRSYNQARYNSLTQTDKELAQENQNIDKVLPSIKQYEQALHKQNVAENVYRHYLKGKLWLVSAFGEGEEQQVAKSWIKAGVPASYTKEIKFQQDYINAKKGFVQDFKIAPVKTIPPIQSFRQVKVQTTQPSLMKSSILKNQNFTNNSSSTSKNTIKSHWWFNN